jgi:hypothetical protein
LQSTHPDYPHRDLCLFFGYQDDSHLYYVHFGKKTDDHANQIFIVNDSDRKKISTKTTPGTDWNDEWQHARIVRDAESGKIEVFFNDMQTPVMVAEDKTFTSGRVGVGSFDDIGNFDHIAVYGNEIAKKQAKLGRVDGKVTLNGKPLAGATVIFQPETGRHSISITDSDGAYDLQYNRDNSGATVGKHEVRISTGRAQANENGDIELVKESVPAKYNVKTALRVEVNAGDNEFNFELRD